MTDTTCATCGHDNYWHHATDGCQCYAPGLPVVPGSCPCRAYAAPSPAPQDAPFWKDTSSAYAAAKSHETPGIDRADLRALAEAATQCIPWEAGCDFYGYGRTTINGRRTRAHRLMWELINGPIPDGMFVLHSCDNPPCVNPLHLRVGTHVDNMADVRDRGRGRNVHMGKTHCPQGHPYAGDNLYVHRGKRYCRTCVRSRSRAYQAARRAAV